MGQVKLERYFVGGTKIEADANKHKMVWAKRTQRYQQRVREQIRGLLEQIEQVNAGEQLVYGDADLEERGEAGQADLTAEQLRKRIDDLNQQLRDRQAAPPKTKPERPAVRQALKKLEPDCLPGLEKYEQQTATLAGRSSYSKTDPQ